MKRAYETCVVYDGTLSDDVVSKEQQQVENFLKENAKLENINSWGKRRLAYEIKKRKSGQYILFEYEAEGDAPTKIEKLFKLNQNVLRYITVRRNPKALAADVVLDPRRDNLERESRGDENEKPARQPRAEKPAVVEEPAADEQQATEKGEDE